MIPGSAAPLRILFALVGFVSARTLATAGTDIAVDQSGNATADVIVELTDAGKRVERPTPERPAYYILIPGGYNPGGQPTFWQRQPPTEAKVLAELQRELAGQGYLVATHEHPPSLILLVSWGYKAPIPASNSAFRMYIGDRTPHPIAMPLRAIANSRDMLALTAGSKASNTWAETDRGAALNEAVVAAGVPRYYTTVIAVDYPGWKRHRYTQLWTARLSVPYWGCYLDEALPALFKAGAGVFGRDMSAPQMVQTSIVPQGRVEVGAPVLKGYLKPDAQSSATQ